MSESFAEMLEESIKQIHTGEIVDGTGIDVKDCLLYTSPSPRD